MKRYFIAGLFIAYGFFISRAGFRFLSEDEFLWNGVFVGRPTQVAIGMIFIAIATAFIFWAGRMFPLKVKGKQAPATLGSAEKS